MAFEQLMADAAVKKSKDDKKDTKKAKKDETKDEASTQHHHGFHAHHKAADSTA